jgi:hypothetical protein
MSEKKFKILIMDWLNDSRTIIESSGAILNQKIGKRDKDSFLLLSHDLKEVIDFFISKRLRVQFHHPNFLNVNVDPNKFDYYIWVFLQRFWTVRLIIFGAYASW